MNRCCGERMKCINSRAHAEHRSRRYECVVCGERMSTREVVVKQSVRDLAKSTGISYSTLRHRIYQLGYTRTEAVAAGKGTTGGRRKHIYRWHNKPMTIEDLAHELGISVGGMATRIRKHGLHGAMTLPVRRR